MPQSASPMPPELPPPRASRRSWLPALVAAHAWLALSATIVISRWWVGALAQPLPTPLLLAVSWTLAALTLPLALAVRCEAQRTVKGLAPLSGGWPYVHHLSLLRWLSLAGCLLPLAWRSPLDLAALALIGPIVAELPVIAEWIEQWFGSAVRDSSRRQGADATTPASPRPAHRSTAIAETAEACGVAGAAHNLVDTHQATSPSEPFTDASDLDAADEPGTWQRSARSRADDGEESLSVWHRELFPPGQRLATIHLAFCPPFSAVPEFQWEQLSGPQVQVQATTLWPHAARLELRRTATPSPSEALVELAIHFRVAKAALVA